MGKLKAHVHVTGKDGSAVWFRPGDQPPKWAAAKITNPKAWEGEDLPRSTPKAAPQKPSGAPSTGGDDSGAPTPDGGTPDPAAGQEPAGDTPADGGGEPPEAELPKGNATREEWAAYADANGVTYEPEAKREAIKEAVEQAAADKAAAEPTAD